MLSKKMCYRCYVDWHAEKHYRYDKDDDKWFEKCWKYALEEQTKLYRDYPKYKANICSRKLVAHIDEQPPEDCVYFMEQWVYHHAEQKSMPEMSSTSRDTSTQSKMGEKIVPWICASLGKGIRLLFPGAT